MSRIPSLESRFHKFSRCRARIRSKDSPRSRISKCLLNEDVRALSGSHNVVDNEWNISILATTTTAGNENMYFYERPLLDYEVRRCVHVPLLTPVTRANRGRKSDTTQTPRNGIHRNCLFKKKRSVSWYRRSIKSLPTISIIMICVSNLVRNTKKALLKMYNNNRSDSLIVKYLITSFYYRIYKTCLALNK